MRCSAEPDERRARHQLELYCLSHGALERKPMAHQLRRPDMRNLLVEPSGDYPADDADRKNHTDCS